MEDIVENINTEHNLQELRLRNQDRIRQFQKKARSRGTGYHCPNFPMFDQAMEGLQSGLYMIAGESNGGKALKLSTPVLLSNGTWTTIGDIKLGDSVWGDDGKPTNVISKSEIFTDHKCYRITLDDKTVLHADADHRWKVFKYCCHKPNNREMVLKTSDMIDSFKHVNPDGYPRYNYRIPMQKAIEYPEIELPIDPYLLGIWLGDGCATGTSITLFDEDFPYIESRIKARTGFFLTGQRCSSNHGITCHIVKEKKRGKKNPFLSALKKLNLLGNKHIPREYLCSSIEQRQELLKGLMDTDGYCAKDGLCEFVQKESSKIHEGFGELLSSLGIKWSSHKKDARCNRKIFPAIRYNFVVSKDNSCFSLERKMKNLREKLENRSFLYKTIVNIEEIPSEPMQCIGVSNKSHCFLVGEKLTVTHNTSLTLSLLWDFMAHEPNKLYLIFFALDDTTDDIIPKVISMNQDIPISVTSKPIMYENKCDIGDSKTALYEDWLKKSNDGLDGLIELGEKFTILDGTDISCGEEILERCKDIKALIRTEDRNANIIVAIDSLMDIEWRDKSFKSDKELNDYTAKQIKKWAVEILDCPIFGTLHLRKIEQNRRPTIADVKESGRYAYEASFLGLVHNDVSRNKNSAAICVRNEEDEITPVIELNWAKNKVSSYKGMTYQTFITNHSLIKECPKTIADRFDKLIYSN